MFKDKRKAEERQEKSKELEQQLVKLLSALGATLHLHVEADPVEAAASVPRSW